MKVQDVGRWVLLGVSAPWMVVGWVWVMLFYGWATEWKPSIERTMVLTNRLRPWVVNKGWRILQWVRWPGGVMFDRDGARTNDPRQAYRRSLWRYSTTIGRGILYQAHHGERIRAHEHVHVRQCEDASLKGLAFAIIAVAAGGSPWLFPVFWVGAHVAIVGNFLTAWLRGGNPYRDSEHERSAYAQTDSWQGGMTWLGLREERLSRGE